MTPIRSTLAALALAIWGAAASPALGEGRPSRSRATDRSLADTVLARVGGRDITLPGFRKAWSESRGPGNGDSLTREGAGRFLDLLIDRELLAAAARRTPWRPTAEESLGLVRLADHLVVQAALAEEMAVTRTGDAATDEGTLGIRTRERVVASLGVTVDTLLARRLAGAFAALPKPTADSSVAAQMRLLAEMPRVSAADTARVLARSKAGDAHVRDLLDSWRKLDPVYRPRIDSPEQIADLVENVIFERWLRQRALTPAYRNRAEVIQALAAERERLAIARLIQLEVDAHVHDDEAADRRFYAAHAADWVLPTRLDVVSLTLSDRSTASDLAARLRDPAEAESLVARGLKAGVRYRGELWPAPDSTLYARALRAGTGAVVGPVEVESGWMVLRVRAVLPGRSRTFEEVRREATERRRGEEARVTLEALLDRERARSRVVLNPRATAILTGP